MRSGASVAYALALLLLAQCQRNEAPRPEATPAAADAARVGAAAPAPDAAPSVAPAEAADAGPEPAPKGSWLEGNIYRFRLDDVRSCPPPTPPAVARIGAVVRVTSKIDEVLVAPRDFKVEAGGVILDSAVVQAAPAGCAPLLAPKSLRAGKTAGGVVVFDLPAGFNPDHRPTRLLYQPTRWGGAKQTAALLPPESLPR